MKKDLTKLFAILFVVGIFIGSQVFGAVVTERRINKPTSTPTTQQQYKRPTAQTNSKNSTFANNLKMCRPYSESMKSDYMGMNINYNIKIDGWVNNKCRLNFTANASGLSSSFSSIYGIDPSDATVSAFTPKIRCEFTKEQLQYVGDSILEEGSRSNGGRMLKDPNSINLIGANGLSGSDQRILSVVLGQKACTLLNSNDLNNLMNSLMGF